MFKTKQTNKIHPETYLNRNDPIQARIHENLLMINKKNKSKLKSKINIKNKK